MGKSGPRSSAEGPLGSGRGAAGSAVPGARLPRRVQGSSGLGSARCVCASGRTAFPALGSVPAVLAAPEVSDRGGRSQARWPFPKGHAGPAWVLQSSGRPLWASMMDVTQTPPYDGLLSAFLSLCV